MQGIFDFRKLKFQHAEKQIFGSFGLDKIA